MDHDPFFPFQFFLGTSVFAISILRSLYTDNWHNPFQAENCAVQQYALLIRNSIHQVQGGLVLLRLQPWNPPDFSVQLRMGLNFSKLSGRKILGFIMPRLANECKKNMHFRFTNSSFVKT